ncbi:hypothetical protein DAPPUDRAFT_269214 [Daphnia pulex]|uniref:ZSWIM1/3 RNaseH-like domain-containing protein n=1 Tax=Daphnia pulex TaxID=6669 RepID=E9HZ10_DAPPU|nr:hypothetical protein DAPPUDRAFT_269214 [Daphnia pulex]|eukprot:EFX63020.1 hypothetical protein DAPPUDRAFT_269214 [Daphnia pulex]
MELQKNYGIVMKAKDLQNIKQSMTGLAANDWAATCDVLVNLTNNPENLVNVISDEQGDVTCIFVQLAAQRILYQQYGESVQIDATHGATDVPMPLYTLIVTDTFVVGQPVAFVFVREETTENISIGLKQFAENNDVSSINRPTIHLSISEFRQLKVFVSRNPTIFCQSRGNLFPSHLRNVATWLETTKLMRRSNSERSRAAVNKLPVTYNAEFQKACNGTVNGRLQERC